MGSGTIAPFCIANDLFTNTCKTRQLLDTGPKFLSGLQDFITSFLGVKLKVAWMPKTIGFTRKLHDIAIIDTPLSPVEINHLNRLWKRFVYKFP